MHTLLTILLAVAVVGCGVMAGVFFAFSSFIVQGLDRLPAAEAARAMRGINLTAVRAPLMLALFGTMLVALVCSGLVFFGPWSAAAPWVYSATVVQLLGSVIVTGAANVPRNDRLARARDTAEALEAAWRAFLPGWIAWNHVRTGASVIACALFAVALTAL